ncbi:putative ribonuclease H protein [Cardamine amara subsp. amara]|uniref:Ribonuclease H protein n=1 Tax=Cardamine amara subsp. amara TaxID=228776 RepID=A0ABD1BPY2_CARAN
MRNVFDMGIWWSWKWRCENVFGENIKCWDKVKFIKDLASEVTKVYLLAYGCKETGVRIEMIVAWKPPVDGCMRMNIDGVSHGNPDLATAGGAMRDAAGRWCGGFALNIGVCTAPLGELWGVYYRLYIAWGRGVTRLEMEVDSKLVVGFLKTGISDSHPLSFLVRLCHGFLSRDWIVRISHVYRETNRLADGLANYAFTLPLGFYLLESTPPILEVFGRRTAFPKHIQI